VDETTFQRAQEVRIVNDRSPRVNNGHLVRIYPLTGILYCGYCGGHMRGVSAGPRYYYRDGNQCDHTCECPQPIVRAQAIEQSVVKWLQSVVSTASDEMVAQDLQSQELGIEQRYERARELYLSGELDRPAYETEKDRLDIEKDRLRFSEFRAKIALLDVMRPQLD
jgi:hypothetical protein